MLDLAASPLNDIGCYCLSLAFWVFEGETPEKVQVVGKTKNGERYCFLDNNNF